MTTTTWTNTSGGDFDTASNWNNGVPQPGDTVLITAQGPYTVSIEQANSVGILNMAKGVRLGIHDFELDITGGTGNGALAGRIVVNHGTSLVLGATATTTTFNLTGSILLKGTTDSPAQLGIVGDVTLSGGGVIGLLGKNDEITGNNATLTNADTIKSTGSRSYRRPHARFDFAQLG
jgi:hypothetical protein